MNIDTIFFTGFTDHKIQRSNIGRYHNLIVFGRNIGKLIDFLKIPDA